MPKILLAYTCVANGNLTDEFAARFVGTYLQFPPGVEHETVIVCNGGPLKLGTQLLFSPIPCTFFPRSNNGWDIGGYIEAAKKFECDMLVCLGESVYFHREGWLKKLADAWQRYGPGMYGPFASYNVRAHLQTTAFCCAPKHLQDYSQPVRTKRDRYQFEHGEYALWRRLALNRTPTNLVTWDGVWEPRQWRMPANILFRGDQSNCLFFANHTQDFEKAPAYVKAGWSRAADIPFK